MAQSRGAGPRPRATGGATQKSRSAPPGRQRTGPAGVPGPWAPRPGRLGVAIVAGGTAIGTALTMLTGSEPGLLLGLFVIAATIVATLIVSTRAAYVIIPVPAIAYPCAALLAGYVHDRATDTSLTALAVGAVQWIASGFIVMVAATAIAIVITAGRWMFIGPGGQRAYRDPPLRGARAARYRGIRGTGQSGGQSQSDTTRLPAGPRRSG